VERRLAVELELQELGDAAVAVDRRAFAALPAPLQPDALALLHRRAGVPYPAAAAARAELLRQLAQPAGRLGRVGCDCGAGWRWAVDGDLLVLRRAAEREPEADFTYTLEIPGELEIPELAVRVGLHHRPVEPWMFAGAPHRAGLALPLAPGDRVTVRNRRPGDRLRPLGSSGSRRLKEVLVDRRVPRARRERIPLVCVGERIAWVPGVTIEHGFRIRTEAAAWVATLTSMRPESR
jgi:tRNA(Ile)-lysidine synthase